MLLAPLFLLGLLGIGLPLWLHRFARNTRTKEPFASLMLLEPSEIHQSREHTLRYWLLLALRVALLALIVLAFAQPMLPWHAPPLEARDRTLHVIVLDTSLSMQQGARWTRAVEKARSLIDALRPADQGMLVTADSRVRVVKGPVNQSDADELRTALASIRPGAARLDYGMLMTSAPSWIGTERPPTQFHLITDLQQSATPLQFADLEPPEGVKLVLEDVGDASAANQYIRSVAPSERDSNVLEVHVAGTPNATSARTMILTIDGKERARAIVNAATGTTEVNAGSSPSNTPDPAAHPAGRSSESAALPGRASTRPPETPAASASQSNGPSAVQPPADARVLFTGLDLGPGTHRVSVALQPADSLREDDTFYSVLERREPRALVVGANNAGDDVAYFAAAVGALTNPHLAVEQSAADALGQRSLADYSTLIVSDVGVLSGASVGALQKYLEGGGSVLMTLGPRAAQRDRIPLSGHTVDTRAFKAQSATHATDAAAADPATEVAGRVAAIEESHPALRDTAGWRNVRFFRYVPVTPLPQDRVLIRFEDGHPLLIERQIGAGRLLVLTSPLDRDWSDLAIHPLFVRFIGEAARYLTAASATANTIVGQVLPTGVNGRNGAQVFDPDGKRVLSLGDTASQTRLLAERPGFYEVRGGGRSEWLAVNADARESDLARMPEASLTQWRGLQTPERAPASARQAGAEAAPQRKPLWRWLLLLAVTLAFIEPLVANSHLHVRRGVAS